MKLTSVIAQSCFNELHVQRLQREACSYKRKDGESLFIWFLSFCFRRIADVMDIASEDFVNKNLYEFCHAEDLQKLQKAHIDRKLVTSSHRHNNSHEFPSF